MAHSTSPRADIFRCTVILYPCFIGCKELIFSCTVASLARENGTVDVTLYAMLPRRLYLIVKECIAEEDYVCKSVISMWRSCIA